MCQSQLQVTNQSLCPKRLKSTDFKSMNYAFGGKWDLSRGPSHGTLFQERDTKFYDCNTKSLGMFSNVLDLSVALCSCSFLAYFVSSFPTLTFSASFLLCTLIRTSDLRRQAGISLGLMWSLTQSFLEREEGLAKANRRKPSGSTHSPTLWCPYLEINPPMSFPNPGPASANGNWLPGLFQLACAVLVHTVHSVWTSNHLGLFT